MQEKPRFKICPILVYSILQEGRLEKNRLANIQVVVFKA